MLNKIEKILKIPLTVAHRKRFVAMQSFPVVFNECLYALSVLVYLHLAEGDSKVLF
jgi:hypothetical protein